jgi:hypothetical protein
LRVDVIDPYQIHRPTPAEDVDEIDAAIPGS